MLSDLTTRPSLHNTAHINIMSLLNSHFPVPKIWIVTGKKKRAFNRLLPKNVGSFMRVSTVYHVRGTVFPTSKNPAFFVDPFPLCYVSSCQAIQNIHNIKSLISISIGHPALFLRCLSMPNSIPIYPLFFRHRQ